MATVNIYDMADTWNASGTTFNSIMMDISNGTGGAPSYAAGSRAINIKRNGTSKFGVAVEGGIIQALEANFAALAVTGYSLTGSNATSMIDLSGTLNTTGSPDVFALRITDTARGASTRFLHVYGGASGTTSVFSLDRSGMLYVNNAASTSVGGGGLAGASGSSVHVGCVNGGVYLGSLSNFGADVAINGAAGILKMRSALALQWSSDSTSFGTADLSLLRDAANILAQRNSTSAQTSRIYSTYSDASNGAWGFLDSAVTTAATLTLGTSGNGTGASTLSKFQVRILGATKFDYAVSAASTWTLADTLQLGSTSSALRVGTHSAIGAETVTGYITIKDSAGTDRKIAVVS